MNNDEDIWRTSKSGKHFQIDTESGEVTKGNIGTNNVKESDYQEVANIKDAPVISPTSKRESFADFCSKRPEESISKTVIQYVREYYVNQIGVIEAPKGVPSNANVVFMGSAAREAGNKINHDKLKAIPYIDDIYNNGCYLGWRKDQKEAQKNRNVEKFHYTGAKLKLDDGKTYQVTICSKELKTEDFLRFYMIDKADIAEDHKNKLWKENVSRIRARQSSGSLSNDLSTIISNDADSSDKILEFFDLTVEEIPKESQMNKDTERSHRRALSFDAASKRRYDDNGFMHVDDCHITKEQVVPYYGNEIPGWEHLGLSPTKIYYGYRPAAELQKAVETFNGLPLLLHHHPESANSPQKEYRVGAVGTSAVWNAPYIDNVLSITDKTGIQAINDGYARELSSAYQYDPDFTSGEFEGEPYDFIMRNIRGNHVALVEKGRAGPDVVVADAQLEKPNFNKGKTLMSKLKDFFKGAWDGDPENLDKKDATANDEDKAAAIRKILVEMLPEVSDDKIEALAGTLKDLGYSKAEDEDPKEGLNPAEAFKTGENDQIKKEERAEIPGGKDDTTGELIAAGENHERDKLMSEHAAEAKKAWDACGKDDADAAVQEAFIDGFIQGKCAESTEKFDPIAQDAAIDSRVNKQVKAMEEKFAAAEEVGRHVGAVRAMAFDSANDIFIHGLKAMGVPEGAYSAGSARDVFRMAVKMHNRRLAQDSTPAPAPTFEGKFKGLNNIL